MNNFLNAEKDFLLASNKDNPWTIYIWKKDNSVTFTKYICGWSCDRYPLFELDGKEIHEVTEQQLTDAIKKAEQIIKNSIFKSTRCHMFDRPNLKKRKK